MPIAGFVRLRKHQFGRQAAFGTKVAATRAYPFKGVPDVDLAWTDPGHRRRLARPRRPADSRRSGPHGPAHRSRRSRTTTIPILMCALLRRRARSRPRPGRRRRGRTTPASLTVDDPDVFTYEFGDDVLTDWYQLGDGMLRDPRDSRARKGSARSRHRWAGCSDRWPRLARPTARTARRSRRPASASTRPTRSSTSRTARSTSLDRSPVSPRARSATRSTRSPCDCRQEIDQKRWANGDQVVRRRRLWPRRADDRAGVHVRQDGGHRRHRLRVRRLDERRRRSTATSGSSSSQRRWPRTARPRPTRWTITMPLRYYTRTEGEVGGNTIVVLTGHAFYDPDDIDGVFTSVAVCTLDRGRARRDRQLVTMVDIDCLCPPTRRTGESGTRHGDTRHAARAPRLSRRSRRSQHADRLPQEDDDRDVDAAEILAVLTEDVPPPRHRVVDPRGRQEQAGPRQPVAIREHLLSPTRTSRSVVGDAADELYADGGAAPFDGPGVDLLAAYADGAVDISADGLADAAPEALEAILDYHYPDGRHRDDFSVARWRLQLLAELGVGRLVREQAAVDDGRVANLRRVTHGQ